MEKLSTLADSIKLPRSPYSEEEAKKLERELEDRRTRQLSEDYLNKANIPHKFKAILKNGFKSLEPKWDSNVDACRKKLGRGAVLAMLGTRGTGKTLAGCCLIREWCQRPESAMYTTALEFFIKLRSCYSQDAERTEESVLRSFARPRLLVIDEVHERGDTQWSDRMLTYIVNERYQSAYDTILIANQTPEEFSASAGPSIVDRAREGGGVIVFNWPSMRGKP